MKLTFSKWSQQLSLNMAASGSLSNDDEFEIEDKLNEFIEARKMPENASFFAFTATPKAKKQFKCLEMYLTRIL